MDEVRLKNLKKRFNRDKLYNDDYARFMENVVQKEYVEKSSEEVQQGKK